MVNTFLKFKTKNILSTDFSIDDIVNSQKILFSIFTRYGDTIIDLVVIKEFVETYKDKEYLVLCPKQMIPYVNEILPNTRVIGFNKRNIIDFLKVNFLLKKEKFDLGFNPWSNGIDSCYFSSFCKKFLFYKDFVKPDVINHYEVVRKYLKLPNLKWKINDFTLKNEYKTILICPESTDDERSLSKQSTEKLIRELKKTYKNVTCIIASIDINYNLNNCEFIKLQKSRQASFDFLELVKNIDLVICVDSGPLHIMTALSKDVIGVFNTTSPQTVVNKNSKIKIVKSSEILGGMNA